MIRYVQPSELWDVWPFVSKGIAHTVKKTKDRYTPDDVWKDLQERSAWLFLIADRGFVILQVAKDTDGYALFVFCIYGRLKTVESAMWKWLHAVKSNLGCKRIRWESSRKGWATRGKLVKYVYEVE